MSKTKKEDRPSKISVEWFYGMDPSEHQEFEKTWRNSTFLTDKLKGILERRLKELEVDKPDDYNNPQWPVLRADKNGEVRALQRIIRLLP